MGHLIVSEVKERFRFRHDLGGSLTFIVSEVKERFPGSPKRSLFEHFLAKIMILSEICEKG